MWCDGAVGREVRTMSAAKAPKGKVQQNVVLSPEVVGGDVVSLKESKTQVRSSIDVVFCFFRRRLCFFFQ
jgi:hypothetical protein